LCESASKNQPRDVSLAFGTPLGVGTSHGHLDTQDSPRPGPRGMPPPSPIEYTQRRPVGATSKWHKFPGLPKWSPEIVLGGVPGLWELITPDCKVRSRRGLNQSCSPRRELSNAVSHSRSARREQVYSRLLVVGSQTGSLTPGPSFAHNLGYRCPNDQCEAIFDIYALRPFQ
jgi:hypothetical protein